MGRRRCAVTIGLAAFLAASPATAQKTEVALPVLVPLAGSVEGTSQRNGATLAARQIRDVTINTRVLDTQFSSETAVTAWERAVRTPVPPAVVGPFLARQMQALMPLAQAAGIPLLTISGAARLNESGNPYFFRFFPSDVTVKTAHARYVVEKLGAKRPAVIYQNSAYGQSGREQLAKAFAGLKAPPVVEEGVAPEANDLSAALGRAKAANADAIVLHLHAASTVLAVRQARQILPGLPIVAGSALHQPETAAQFEAAQLQGVCAEAAASPISAADGPLKEFADSYRQAFKSEPDAYAAAQYDAVRMLGTIAADLRKASAIVSPIAVRSALARDSYKGLVTTYKSDGKGNMAHEALIVCYDGKSRIPQVVERYEIR